MKNIKCSEDSHDIDITVYYDRDEDALDNLILLSDGENKRIYGFEHYNFHDCFCVNDDEAFLKLYNAEFKGEDEQYDSVQDAVFDMLRDYELINILRACTSIRQIKVLLDDDGINDWNDVLECMTSAKKNNSHNNLYWQDIMPKEALNKAVEETLSQMVDNFGWDYFNSNDFDDGVFKLNDKFYYYEDYDHVIIYNKTFMSYRDIDNMINSTPFVCIIEVDGDEYYVSDEVESRYNYDKYEIINVMEKLMGDKFDDEISEYLDDNLPDYPDNY